MQAEKEKRIIARGLNPEGALLLVKREIDGIKGTRVRVIVSGSEQAESLVSFLAGIGANAEVDTAGDDYHVIADLV